MITYSVEKFEDYEKEIKPLLKAHWEEVAINKDKVKLNPDYDSYRRLDSVGALHSVIVRDGTRLIGYFISFIQPHLHYQDHKFATNDILYLDPEYRNQEIATEMFTVAEIDLKEKGISVMGLHVKVTNRFDSLCDKLGFKKTEIMYSKFLGD